ncbi:MAG TPA: phosphotransferase [Nocardioides sp.]|jgi:Ser/Thr protein kinase RdoA (MazF antagonist)|uniref:phosphotransferase family protein n=1 Tax=Nocardioides sp. TaxID=35761 RepID=UPI002E3422C6|nr:phosphotransferase [Nocardioides sp.]HEX3930589.1 phosphotransferase [Nocardioides sp.]
MDFADLTPLAGGWSGQTYLAQTAGERTVVRVYPPRLRDDAAPEIDAAVLRLVRGLVPVPDVLEVRRGAAEGSRPGLLVTSFVTGVRGDLLLTTLDEAGLAVLGGHLGSLVATVAGMPTLRPGPFVDPELTIGDFGMADGLPGFVAEYADSLGWPAADLSSLMAVAEHAQSLLDSVGRSCLVHSDANPKNVLVDPESLVVTAVFDWEFAHSGCPVSDLGNLLRFDRVPAYADAVLAAWCERRGTCPAETLELARAADLWALVDLAARRGQNPVADRAHEHLLAIARTGDLHALPS